MILLFLERKKQKKQQQKTKFNENKRKDSRLLDVSFSSDEMGITQSVPYVFVLEKAMQQVAMFLRSVPNWEIVEPLPDIGKYIVIHSDTMLYVQY